jgi:hypothetical protein
LHFYLTSMMNSIDLNSPQSALVKVKQKLHLLSLIRIIVFGFIVVCLILGLTDFPLLLLSVPFLILAFVGLIISYNRSTDQKAILVQVLQIHVEITQRKSRQLQQLDGGFEFINKNHPFSSDLDLFGDFSLFQLINRTISKKAKNLLAEWMTNPLDPLTAKKRHTALKEMKTKNDFLLHFESVGKALNKNEKSNTPFFNWLSEKEDFPKYLLPLVFIGPILGLIMVMAYLFFDVEASLVGIWILISMFFLSLVFKGLLRASKSLPDVGNIKIFAAWAQIIENENFEDPYLIELQKPFRIMETPSSKILKDLEQLNFLINNRINLMYLIFNLLFVLDLPIFYSLLKWKRKFGKHLSLWEKTFDEWQVVVSLSAFEAEEKQEGEILWSDTLELNFINVKHPLLEPSKAIGNDFSLGEKEKIVLLTGANMSGKTTFMRTLGINLIIANLGLTPFADYFSSGNFQLFTSMRNSDNLGESMSSFYAELSRIKALINKVEMGEKVFFLLDEILKGTNTSDRIVGSKALIEQLSANAKGIISTHDIELSQLEKSLDYLVNKSFHSEIKDQEILFDYKIKAGACPNFNAKKLMELMGIKLINP